MSTDWNLPLLAVSLFLNVVASAIYGALFLFYNQAFDLMRKRGAARLFWDVCLTSPVNIITPSPPATYRGSSYYLGYSAANALATVSSLLSIFNKAPEGIRPFEAKYTHGRMEENLVLLGGPITNQITQRMMDDFDIPFSFKNHTLIDKRRGNIYQPKVGQDGIQTDYGFVLRMANPYNSKKMLVIIAGCHGYGTYAGSRIVTDQDSLRAITKKVKGCSCAIVIKSHVIQDAVQKPTIIDLFEIASIPSNAVIPLGSK
jgi:hypothetical protein